MPDEPKTDPIVNPVIPAAVNPPVVPNVDGKPAVPPVTPTPAPVDKDGKTILGGEPPKEEKQGAPDKYADFTMPEGVTIDKAVMEKATTEFKSLGLSQENAQKLVTLQAEYAKANNAAILESFNKQVAGWKEQSQKMFGNEYQKEFGIAAKAVERFGSPALKEMLNTTGLGNNPEWVSFCNKIGKAISEDQPIDGKRAGEAKSDADILYPKMGGKK